MVGRLDGRLPEGFRGSLQKLLPPFFLVVAITLSGCSLSGRVLHIDNKDTVPYTTLDEKLKQKLLRALIRRHLITEAQRYTCLINIMEIGRYYVLEVWPDGYNAGAAFGVKLKKPLLVPVEKYTDLQ